MDGKFQVTRPEIERAIDEFANCMYQSLEHIEAQCLAAVSLLSGISEASAATKVLIGLIEYTKELKETLRDGQTLRDGFN